MALDQVRLGTPPLGQDGDDPRTAFTRINNNAKLLDDSGVSGKIAAEREVDNYDLAVGPGAWTGSATASKRPPGFGRASIAYLESAVGGATQVAVDFATGILASRAYPDGAWKVAPTMTQSTTDYTSGRGMRVGDFGLIGTGLACSDFNDAITEGKWKVWLADSSKPRPESGFSAWTVFVWRYDNELTQHAYAEGGTFTVYYVRKRNGPSTWGPWTKVRVAQSFVNSDLNDLNSSVVGYGEPFSFNVGALNRPSDIPYGVVLNIARTSQSEFVQVAYSVTDEKSAKRRLIGGAWQPWVDTTPIGVNQGWQPVTRSAGTAYVNGSRTIVLAYACTSTVAGQYLRININGALGGWSSAAYAVGVVIGVQATIPPGATYTVESQGGGVNAPYSAELR